MEECGGGGDEVLTGGRVGGSESARPGLSHWPRHDPRVTSLKLSWMMDFYLFFFFTLFGNHRDFSRSPQNGFLFCLHFSDPDSNRTDSLLKALTPMGCHPHSPNPRMPKLAVGRKSQGLGPFTTGTGS